MQVAIIMLPTRIIPKWMSIHSESPWSLKTVPNTTYLKNPLRVVRKEYSGPKDMFMVFPYMSMNLCENNSEPDSMIVDVLRYVQEDLTQYKPGENEYSVDLLPYVNNYSFQLKRPGKLTGMWLQKLLK